ncbi:hypothetical protein N1851_013780 [Merluccius polli]|uniref:Uncharacterized protein n=1 Tax=Merluccius polli TaxID=89951 RepID=A0AA47P500_MERPO|nr:hypothetical protein N1851_013780 [Merluccius polli]
MASAADPRFKLRFVEEDNVAVVTGVYCVLCSGGEEADGDYETVLGKLNHCFVPKVNVIHERSRFHLGAQKHQLRNRLALRASRDPPVRFGGNRQYWG